MGDNTVEDELGLLTPERLSGLLGVTVGTLANWRASGKGPSWVRVGRQVRYRRASVDRWLEEVERG